MQRSSWCRIVGYGVNGDLYGLDGKDSQGELGLGVSRNVSMVVSVMNCKVWVDHDGVFHLWGLSGIPVLCKA